MFGRHLVGMGGEKVKFGGSLMCVFHSSILLLGLVAKGTTRRTAIKPSPRTPARTARDTRGRLLRCSDLLAAKEVPLISSRGVAKPFEGRLRPATMEAIARERIMITNCRKFLTKQQYGDGLCRSHNYRSTVLRRSGVHCSKRQSTFYTTPLLSRENRGSTRALSIIYLWADKHIRQGAFRLQREPTAR
jgi:hypothetical protein